MRAAVPPETWPDGPWRPYDPAMRRSDLRGRPARPPRYLLRVPCQVVRLRDFRLVADRVEDVSAGGLLVSPAEPVLTGEPVLISMRFPATGDWLDVEAFVTRIVHGRRPGETARCLGIEFDRLDRFGWLSLHRNLGRTPPAPPRARPGRRHASYRTIAGLLPSLRDAPAQPERRVVRRAAT